jgi:hypothetical protein
VRSISILFMALVGAAPLAARADASGELSSRYTGLGGCTEITHGSLDEGEDWVSHECDGYDGIPIWLRFADSARGYLGFGSRENHSGPFGLNRDDSWPVEWRGVEQDGRFEPFAIIVRMLRPEVGDPNDGTPYLFVFRLRSDGLSCILASDLSSNEEARNIADESRDGYECQFEPDVPRTR